MTQTNEIHRFIEEHETDDVHTLALQAKLYPKIDMQIAIQQIVGKQIAKLKIPSWYTFKSILYPKHLSLEQCSSEHTALYKKTLCKGNSLVDLTGGMGVDFSFMATYFRQATYVEQQPELTILAKENFKILGLTHAAVIEGDAVDYLVQMDKVDMIYIDPARRSDSGKKTVFIEDCTPNIIEIEPLLEMKSNLTMIKLSPMLDITLAVKSLQGISDVHIVSYQNECKELLLIKQKNIDSPNIHCINILNSNKVDVFSFRKEDEDSLHISYTNQVEKYLYEPNSSITKGGAYKSIAIAFNVNKLHVNSHLYTSGTLISNFNGRYFKVEGVCSLNKKELKTYLGDIKQANISTRNFPLTPQEIKKRLGLKDGGDIYIFATTLADEQKVLIICRKT